MERGPPSPSLSFKLSMSKLSMSKWTPECDGHLLALVTGFTENGQNPAFTAIAEHLNKMPCFTWTVTGKSVNARYKDYLDPSVIRGNMTQFEIEAFLSIQTLVRPNNWAFIGGVLGRTANDCKTAWGSVKKPLLATLESLTGRTELTVGEKYDFGSQDVMAKCSQAVLKSYMKKHPTPSNDPRIRTPSSLTKETIASLAREQNLKNAKAKKNTAKKKVCGEKTAERASKRAKKTENAQAVLDVIMTSKAEGKLSII